jgi:hypothetical protein
MVSRHKGAWILVVAALFVGACRRGTPPTPSSASSAASSAAEPPASSVVRGARAGRWLTGADITTDPVWQKEIASLGREPMAAGVAVGFSPRSEERAARDGSPLAARFRALHAALAPWQRRALAFHEAPVLRVWFARQDGWPLDDLDRLATLLGDEGHSTAEFQGPLTILVAVPDQAATSLCLAGLPGEQADPAWLKAIERALSDPALERGQATLVGCLAARRRPIHPLLVPLIARLLGGEERAPLMAACGLIWSPGFDLVPPSHPGTDRPAAGPLPAEIAPIRDRLAVLLSHPHSDVRMAALLAFDKIEPAEAARAAAIERLSAKDPSRRVRETAAALRDQRADRRAVTPPGR